MGRVGCDIWEKWVGVGEKQNTSLVGSSAEPASTSNLTGGAFGTHSIDDPPVDDDPPVSTLVGAEPPIRPLLGPASPLNAASVEDPSRASSSY